MARYALEIKPSARKELENRSDNLIARLAPKIDGLASDPRPSGCRELHGYKDLEFASVITASCTSSMTAKMVSVTRVARRRDVYE